MIEKEKLEYGKYKEPFKTEMAIKSLRYRMVHCCLAEMNGFRKEEKALEDESNG
jgi:hypothetical protein